MREMKDSGIEWIGAIPTTWHTKKMKYISNFIQNKYSSDYGLLPYIGLENIASWSGSFISTNSQYDREQSLICEPEDILFGKLRPYLAKVYMNDRLCCCSNEFAVIRVNGQNKRYMWYQLLSHGFIFEIDRSTYGTKMPRANAEFIRNVFVALPSEIEQQKIANYLDKMCAEIDTVLEKTRASIEEYKKLKQAVITQAVTKGVRGDRPMKNSGIEWIGDIPAEWKVASIGRFCFVTKLAGFEFTNDMMSNIQDSGDIPIVRAQNIKMGKFINNISEFIPYRISQKLERCALNRKCLIITFIGAGIGEVAIFNEPKRYHLAPNVAKIVINVGMEHFVTEEYLLYFLMSFAGQEEINKIKKATAQPSLSMGTIRSIKMVLPDSIEEQSEIVSYLDMRCASIDALIAKKQQYLIEIENYKKSLIYEYVTGKKEVV